MKRKTLQATTYRIQERGSFDMPWRDIDGAVYSLLSEAVDVMEREAGSFGYLRIVDSRGDVIHTLDEYV